VSDEKPTAVPRDYLAELEKHCAKYTIEQFCAGTVGIGMLQTLALFRIEAAIHNAGVYSALGSGIGGLLGHGLTEGLKEVLKSGHAGCPHPLAEHRQTGGCLHAQCYCIEKGGANL
jgi:hypothetical protein